MEALIFVMILIDFSSGVPYNQPKLCPNASWNSNGTLFAPNGTVGLMPFGLFVNSNNNVYATIQDQNSVQIWLQGDYNVSITIPRVFDRPRSVFALSDDDIFVDSGDDNRVVRWSVSTASIVSVFHVPDHCAGLFVDSNDTLYCSMPDKYLVVTASLYGNLNMTTIVAGNGTTGGTSYQLQWPNGIFVDARFNLYVADTGNDRIQLFSPGQLNGTTIVASSVSGTTSLYGPIGVVLDADGHLFILEQGNGRIMGSSASGFRCLAGCNGISGSNLNQLQHPQSLSFDSYGNIFVADEQNSRIIQFPLEDNSCAVTQADQTRTSQTPVVDTTQAETTSHYQTLTYKQASLAISDQLITTNSAQSSLTSSVDSSSPVSATSAPSTVLGFILPSCSNTDFIGSSCNISCTPCAALHPCQNMATCIDDKSIPAGYICQCERGFDGSECEFDRRPCKPSTCWNNGTCLTRNVNDFVCMCVNGWTDTHCQTQVDYCENVICENGGVCRPLFRDYRCECLGSSYFGRHCESTAQTLVIRKAVSQSFGFTAIIFIISAAIFVVTLDVLKYVFHIDPVREERERLRRTKLGTRKKKKKSRRHNRCARVSASLLVSSGRNQVTIQLIEL